MSFGVSYPNHETSASRKVGGLSRDDQQVIKNSVSQPSNYTGTLRRGNSGANVEQLQRDLKAAGFDPGPADGIFGPKTEAAVKQFQAAHAPPVDGIVGPITRSALDANLSGSVQDASANVSGDAQEAPETAPGEAKAAADFLFYESYTIDEIQESLNQMYAAAPPAIKKRASHTHSVVEQSKQRMKRTFVPHTDNPWG